MTPNWSWFISAIVVLNIVGCVWLIRWTGKRRPGDPKPEDTSHWWDGDLTEYNKPMPRWWLALFYITIVFGIVYLVWFPGMGSWKGTSGWTSSGEHDRDRAEALERSTRLYARFDGVALEQLAADTEALRYGQSIFANNCAACHGSDARGAKGFPNLSDQIWHWGGSADAVLASVLDGRIAAMPPMASAVGGAAELDQLVAYVQSLSGQPVRQHLAEAGKPRFVLCAACHGPDGKGNIALGAPDLTDGYWLYGGDAAAIRETIVAGRNGVMPAHGPLLGPVRARLAAAWVYARSRSEAGAAVTAEPVSAP